MNKMQVVEKYGKPLIRDLLDMIIVYKDLTPEEIRKVLIKHELIKKTTKIIRIYFNRDVRGKELYYSLTIKNGRNQLIFNGNIFIDTIEEILRD